MFLFVCLSLITITTSKVCSVLDYGAVGNGIVDDTKSIQTAIDSCNSTINNSVIFPSSYNFLSYPFSLTQNNTELLIDINTTITAAPDPINWPTFIYANEPRYVPLITRSDYWIYNNQTLNNNISNLYNITISGHGLINGNGQIWWQKYHHTRRPDLISLEFVENINISFITLLNSPMYNLWISKGKNVVIHDINITSPDYNIAPNTDGIDIGATNAHIYNCYVKNGDDSYALKNGAQNILFENSIAIQGNGLEGGWYNEGNNNNCTFRNIICNNTPYGIRLRSLNNMSYDVTNIHFHNITLNNVGKALDINQFNQSIDNKLGYTGFNNISFTNIYGTYTKIAGEFDCSEERPCHGLLFDNIALKSINNNSQTWICSANVYGKQYNVTPPINCLQDE